MTFSIAVSLIAIAGTALLFFLWMVISVYFQHRRIKTTCLTVGRCLMKLKSPIEQEYAHDLGESEKASFAAVRSAFASYIRPHVKYRDNLLRALNAICGTSYTIIDMYDCFDNGRLNSFFRDIVGRSGYLFVNMLYLAQLEQNGFESINLVGIGRHL